ncbi:hypothetical protein TVAG_494190 [Trichomonas vaginalis G3]|uniref:Right handed beta helix domain-containing protein n=1 Tax=Trichomonas vaginalis (strain ATCC PRA-98 / G3) TaxID=412133 RepID=A2DQ50_TRIV3|nr:pectin lyase-like family [Trichomonas vaginalis G3]EAY17477.1 hypothetical protein TVAG_494190 [Trichomonas vaginalis G3]KAI5533582.1 pectin lyase-like family [Trichomonas vaginalis G3]|eukprot:XP_001329612.1 hypothetical protein [Trichomonas vaginalis G3]
MAVGNCSMKNVLFNFTNTIPISGYYEEAILDYLLKESVTDTNKYASKPLTIKDLKGEIIIDTVIFENISSTNNGGAVSICCFSSNILITNCMFDQCTSNSFTQETSGGAIYIVGHNTYSNLRNVLSTNCQAGRCHFCYIYSNYLTSLTRTTVCKCAPDNYISDPDTLYIFYDNFFESCNISNNYMGLYLIYSFEDINFTDCVIASNTLVQGQCYIVGIEIKLDKCIIYNNTYHGPGNVTFSTFLIFNIEFNDCFH